jgi:uncharacterized coiled-coil protein SlyX
MPELAALVATIGQLNDQLESAQASLDQVNARLDRLPENFIPRDEAKEKARKVRRWITGLGVAGMFVAGTLGITLYTTHETTCGVRGVLILAKTASSRNPIPADIPDSERARVEAQRAQAAAFYNNALEKLPILWGC